MEPSRSKQIANLIFQKESQIKMTEARLQSQQRELAELKESLRPIPVSVSKIEEATSSKSLVQSSEKNLSREEEDKRIKELIQQSSLLPPNVPVKQKKWYAIFNGPYRGVYTDWDIANSIVSGKNYAHKAYLSEE